MSYVFFEDVLEELGHKLTYDAVVNYAGNSFCEKSWELIADHNPMTLKKDTPEDKAMQGIAKMFGSANVKIGRLSPGKK